MIWHAGQAHAWSTADAQSGKDQNAVLFVHTLPLTPTNGNTPEPVKVRACSEGPENQGPGARRDSTSIEEARLFCFWCSFIKTDTPPVNGPMLRWCNDFRAPGLRKGCRSVNGCCRFTMPPITQALPRTFANLPAQEMPTPR